MRWLQILTLAALLGTGCAHAPPPSTPGPLPTWPPPPQPAAVRWVASFPDPQTPPPPASPWRWLLEVLVGPDRPSVKLPLLQRPFGMAALPDGFLVTDPDARNVLKVRWPGATHQSIACAGHPWSMPMAVASSSGGEIFVADGAGWIARIAPDGSCRTFGQGQLLRPAGLAVLGARLYVVDPPRHQVLAFSTEGQELFRFGQRGEGRAELNFPTAIAAGPAGTLWVVDALNFRLVRFRQDGQPLETFGEPGDGGGAFGRPKAVAVDGAGQLYVTDAQHDVVIAFDRLGRFRLAFGGTGSGPGALTLPAGIALDGARLYVADTYNHRVQIYERVGGAP